MIFDSLIARFRAADRNTRLESLLDYSRKLPPIPDALRGASDRESHRVTECQTPVFLWVGITDGKVTLHADVPRESPTVRGFVSLLASRINQQLPGEVAAIPDDLLDQLALGETLGMTRTQGLSSIVRRVKRMVLEAAA